MSGEGGMTKDFVDKWLEEHSEPGEGDTEVVALVQRWWRKGQLNEDALLRGLIRMAKDGTEER